MYLVFGPFHLLLDKLSSSISHYFGCIVLFFFSLFPTFVTLSVSLSLITYTFYFRSEYLSGILSNFLPVVPNVYLLHISSFSYFNIVMISKIFIMSHLCHIYHISTGDISIFHNKRIFSLNIYLSIYRRYIYV